MMSPSRFAVVASVSEQKRGHWARILIYALLGVWSLICLFPLYWIVVTSFKVDPEIINGTFTYLLLILLRRLKLVSLSSPIPMTI